MKATLFNLPWANELPTEWRAERLKDLVKKIGSGVTPSGGSATYLSEGIPLLRSQNVHFYGLRMDDVAFISDDVHASMSNSQVAPNDVLLNITGASIGRCNIVPSGFGEANVNQHVCIIRLRHESEPRFVRYVLSSPIGQDQVFTSFTGASREGLNFRDLGQFLLPLPPYTEQQRIADYLDVSCEAIERAVETKQKQLDTLDALRKSIITPAVLHGLSESYQMKATHSDWLAEIPGHWKLVSLKRVSDAQTGVTLGKTYEGELVERPYLRAANVQDGYLDLEKITTIEMPSENVSRYELRHGDVLMTEGGDLDKLGRGFLWEGQIEGCLHQNHVFAIRTVRHKLLPEFLTYLTTSQFGRDYFEATGKRTTNLASTNSTKVGQLPVPLPPIDEQKEIVLHLNERLSQTKSIETAIRDQVKTLNKYRKSLIHECVTGKRRVSDDDVAKVKCHV